jgi:hypothetical protein
VGRIRARFRHGRRQAFCILSPTGSVVGCEVSATRDLVKPPTLELIGVRARMHLHNCHDFHDFRRLAKRRLPAPWHSDGTDDGPMGCLPSCRICHCSVTDPSRGVIAWSPELEWWCRTASQARSRPGPLPLHRTSRKSWRTTLRKLASLTPPSITGSRPVISHSAAQRMLRPSSILDRGSS